MIKQKLELLTMCREFASELDQGTLIINIIEKTRHVLDADRCALFLLDAERQKLWSKLDNDTTVSFV